MPHDRSEWLTLFYLAFMTAATIAYDIMIIRTAGPDASISRVLGRLLQPPCLFTAAVFWLGLLVGHFWLPAR